MTYETLIETVSEIVDNDNIEKKGLILTYELSDEEHVKTNENLSYKLFTPSLIPVYTDIFEVEIGGLLVRFTKKPKED